jgi:uncharacterized protein (TIGR03790 family)
MAVDRLATRCLGATLALTLIFGLPDALWAGGSGLNVVIVVNQNSSNSVQLGNYYRERRNVPPQNFLRVNWPGGNEGWTNSDLNTTILNPLLAMFASRQLTNQIDYVVLSMGFPYRVASSNSAENSTTATLFYGFWSDTNPPCTLALGSSNAYAASEGIFRSTPPIDPASNSFLAFMITDTNLAAAKAIVDQGVSSDSTFPMDTAYLAKSTDTARNVRYLEFDNTVFNTRLRGNYLVVRTNLNDNVFIPDMLGLVAGTAHVNLLTNAFVPGAMGDTLTSFGGLLFENPGQTVLLSFLEAGAAGSFGSITEGYEDICNYPQKFPDTQNLFYQSRGFSLGESYYMSLTNPYQGLLVGEPLAAPFALPGVGSWTGISSNSVLAGVTNLSLRFTAPDPQHPIQQVDLFLDGLWLETITNIAPHPGDVLDVNLNGRPTNYTVAAGDSIKSVTSNLVVALNGASYSNATKILAQAHGDRIELHSLDPTKTGTQLPLAASLGVISPQATTLITPSRTNFLDTLAFGLHNLAVTGAPSTGSTLTLSVAKTNGVNVPVPVTNITTGATTLQFAQQLVNAINAAPGLQGPDGLNAQDLEDDGNNIVDFNLYANTLGYATALIQTSLATSPDLAAFPSTTNTLTDNLGDLQPRNHIYITAGVTNLSITFSFNAAALADGWHELAAVAYEGSHVRTQTRATQNVRIQNTSLSATLTPLLGGSTTAVSATLQFAVAANTNNISRIELFSTGGSLGAVTNQSSTIFSIPGTNLDLGLHPFYAVVTAAAGKSCRTATFWIRLIGPEPPFTLQVTASPTRLVWTATAGRSYDILSTTNLAAPFQLRGSIIPANSQAVWTETNPAVSQLLYRVRVTP